MAYHRCSTASPATRLNNGLAGSAAHFVWRYNAPQRTDIWWNNNHHQTLWFSMYRTTENRRMRNPPCVSCRMSSVVKPTSQLKMNWLHPVVKVTMWIHHFNHIFFPPRLLKGKIPHFQLPLGAAHYGGFTLIPIKLLFGFCYFTFFFPVLF